MPRIHGLRLTGLLTLVALVALAAACQGVAPATPSATPQAPSAGAPAAPLAGKIAVFAAASLTDVFRAIGDAFTRDHPGLTVAFNFQSSSALATQIEQGAPADLFAAADLATMARLTDRGLIEGLPATFGRNAPVIVTPADNRAGILAPRDLARPGIKLVLAAPDVPIGNYARQVIDRLAAAPSLGPAYREATLRNLVSNEANVRAVLTKIELGEADAAIVYRTDARQSGTNVRTVAIPDAANVIATYPIAVVKASKQSAAAAAFLAFVRGAEGQRLLRDAGFDPAP